MKKAIYIFTVFLLLHPAITQGQNFSDTENLFNGLDENFTPLDEYYIGRAVAANILSKYRIYNGNQAINDYLNLICRALVINSNNPHPYNGFFVTVLDSNELNAFAAPGGHILITKGFIDAAPSEDALAAIIAHEIAHIILRHGMISIENSRLFAEVGAMAARYGSNRSTALFNDSVNDLLNTMIESGYSVQQEFEADDLALNILAQAGYSPLGLHEILSVMQRVQGNNSGGFYGTHPAPSRRIANANNKIRSYRIQNTSSFRTQRFNRIMGR